MNCLLEALLFLRAYFRDMRRDRTRLERLAESDRMLLEMDEWSVW